MNAFEIFKTGKATDKDGRQHDFTEAMVREIAESYDPTLHEAPMVVGHPANDGPAYGWVQGLTIDGERLVAIPDQVEPAFAEMVKDGRFKKRSASFYPPSHPGNPKPGKWYLKHVGFLGALPPAIKGLKPVSFAEDDADVVVVEFGEAERAMGWALRNMAQLARGFREYILGRDGEDAADKIIPNYAIDQMVADSARIDALEQPSFSEPNPEDNVKLTQEQLDARAAELEQKEAELKTRETAIDAQAASFSEAEKKNRRAANALAIEDLIKAGKFAPALKAETLDFLDGLDGATAVEFGEGDGKVSKTPAQWFLDLLGKSGTIIDFSEHAAVTDATAELGDPQALANKAVAFQEEQRGKGIEITIEQAVRHVAQA